MCHALDLPSQVSAPWNTTEKDGSEEKIMGSARYHISSTNIDYKGHGWLSVMSCKRKYDGATFTKYKEMQCVRDDRLIAQAPKLTHIISFPDSCCNVTRK